MLMSLKITVALTYFLLMFEAGELSAEVLPDTSNQIITASWFEIDSKILNETRRYSVYLPLSYNQNPSKKYSVLYVLDGHETRIKGLAGMVESLAHADLSQQIPELIVVAIASDNRSLDMTPTKADLTYEGRILQKMKDNSGGANRFTKFIQNELFSIVDAKFRTNESRGIVGMSLGGLLAADILLSKPNLFSHYLIADATFVWDNNYLNNSLLNAKQSLSKANTSVFIGLANNDNLGKLGITNRKWGNDFIENLSAINNKQLKISSKYFPDEQHGTVMFLAFYHGLLELYNPSGT